MFRLAYKNFAENKLRTLGIICTIAIALSILFLSFSYRNIVNAQFDAVRKIEAENADIRIEYASGAPSRIISTAPLEHLKDSTTTIAGVLDLYGQSTLNGNIQYINLRGINFDDLFSINNLQITKGVDRQLKNDEIIIDEYTSAILNLDIDSMLEIKVAEVVQRFFVAQIVKNHASFDTDGAFVMYCTDSAASKFIGGYFGNIYNKIFITAAPNVQVDKLILAIQDIPEYAKYTVAQENDNTKIQSQAKNASLPMVIALYACAGFALYIVYLVADNFLKRKTLFVSRMQSIGAPKRYILGIFLCESLLYAVFGLILGLGVGLIVIQSNAFNLVGTALKDSYYIKQLVLSGAVTAALFILCMLSALVKNSREPIIARYKEAKNTLRKTNKPLITASLLAFLLSIVLILPTHLNAYRGIASFILCFISMIILLPSLASIIMRWAKRQSKGGVFYVAANNIACEKTTGNNLRIIFSGMVICSVLASATYLTGNIKDSTLTDLNCDIVIANVISDNDLQLSDISAQRQLYNINAVNIKDATINLGGTNGQITLLSVQPDRLENIGKITYITPKDSLIAGLDAGIALNYSYHKTYKVALGDKVPITLNGITRLVEVTAFFQTYQYGGKLAIMSNEFMSATFGTTLYDTVIAQTSGGIDSTVIQLRAHFGDTNMVILSLNSLYSAYQSVLKNTVMLTGIFALIIMLVCLLSVIFNIINTRQEKKLETYKIFTLGFSKKKIMLIELYETVLVTIMAFLASNIALIVLNGSLTNAFSMDYLYINNPLSFTINAIVGTGFTTLLVLNALTAYFAIDKKKIGSALKVD